MGNHMSKAERIRELTLLIRINERMPAELRCDDIIAKWRAELARLQRRHLRVIGPDDQPAA